MAHLTPAEEKVRKLARLPSNCVCPNCGAEKKFGFSNICIKFLTFVCNECKSSHQAISHRCKSLTMSSWDTKEVEMLAQGGNDVARRTWLKNAPPCGTGGRPKPGSDINVYKAFVVDVYERRRYYGEDDGAPGVPQQKPLASPPRASPPLPNRPPAAIAKAPVSAPLPVMDLLDFSAPAVPVAAAPSTNAFAADFSFAPSAPVSSGSATAPPLIKPPPAAAAPTTPSLATSSDLAFAPSSFGFVNNAPAPTPVMSTATQSNAISNMGGMTMGNNMSMNPGMQTMMNPQMMQQQQQMMLMQQQRMMMMQQQPNAMGMNSAMNNSMGMSSPHTMAMNQQQTMMQQNNGMQGRMTMMHQSNGMQGGNGMTTMGSGMTMGGSGNAISNMNPQQQKNESNQFSDLSPF